jgi:hypothetical protein
MVLAFLIPDFTSRLLPVQTIYIHIHGSRLYKERAELLMCFASLSLSVVFFGTLSAHEDLQNLDPPKVTVPTRLFWDTVYKQPSPLSFSAATFLICMLWASGHAIMI